ncbi:uncharacterized protein LOC135955702 [Calliphora vicina]|uniref:uncharacterized protein LOC135955702 n=1 Tax=Calliphora vicina TaxID=7373 RepID=UPI00325BE112
MLHFLVILILLLTPLNAASKKKTRPLYFLSVKYDMNPKLQNNFEISINADNTSINILFDLREDLDNIWGSTNILIWLKNLKAYKQIITYDVNVCYHLQRGKMEKTNIFNVWMQNILKFSNITKSCPVVKNIYYVSNLKPDKDSIPPFTPAGRCRLLTSMYTNRSGFKEAIGSAEIDIELK